VDTLNIPGKLPGKFDIQFMKINSFMDGLTLSYLPTGKSIHTQMSAFE
jgi:hypothetical protein